MWPDEVSQHEAAMVSPCTGRRPYTKLASIIYVCALTGGPSLHVYVARARQRCMDCVYDERKIQALGFMINLSSHYNKTNFEAVQG